MKCEKSLSQKFRFSCPPGPSTGRKRSVRSCVRCRILSPARRAALAKAFRDDIGIGPFRAPTLKPFGVIVFPAAHFAQDVDHAGRAVRVMLGQPFMEKVLQLIRQAQHDVACIHRACLSRCIEHGLNLCIIQRRDNGRIHHSHRDAGFAEHADRL